MPNLPKQYQHIPQRFPLLTFEQECELSRRWTEHGDVRAQETLVMSNILAVFDETKKYLHFGLDIEDLIQQGLIGLTRATDRYDPTTGNRFLTYAGWWILAEINRYVEVNIGSVRFGTNEEARRAQRGIRKTLREIKIHHPGLSEEEEFEMAAEMMEVSVELCRAAYSHLAGQVNLEDQAGPGDERTRMDILFDEGDEENITGTLLNGEYRHLIEQALVGLTEREAYIIRERWLSDDPATLEECGEAYEVTRERIRQVEAKTMVKLKHLLADQIDAHELA